MTKNRLFIPLCSIAACVLFHVAGTRLVAAEFRSGDKVLVGLDEVIDDDLYAFGGEVTINGTVKGDLIAAGGIVKINGIVEGDLLGAGQIISVKGSVEDDVRIAGQLLTFGDESEVGGDVVAAGFSIETEAGGAIDGELLYAGYQALLAGNIADDVRAETVGFELRGEVAGDVHVTVEGKQEAGPPPNAFMFGPKPEEMPPLLSPGLTLTDSAHIGGNLNYQAPAEEKIDPNKIGGKVEFKPTPVAAKKEPTLAERALDRVRRFGSLFIVGLALLILTPRWTRRVTDNLSHRPIASFALGFVGVIGIAVVAAALFLATILFAILFGLMTLEDLVPVTIFVGLFSTAGLILWLVVFTIYIAQVMFSVGIGRLILFKPLPGFSRGRFVPMLLGLVIFVGLASIPYVDFVLNILAILFGLGAVCLWCFAKPLDESPRITDPLHPNYGK